MTGPASSKSRMYLDFDGFKNQEWLRRRKLRLEQVRKQSNDIAKVLREKAFNEEKIREDQYARYREAELRCWKVEKLEEMERKLKCAIEEFGRGHQLAEEDSGLDKIIVMKNKINFMKAQERGEIAKQQEFNKKRLEEQKKMSLIHRKKMTRKLEDLRSALVRSLSAQKQLLEMGDSMERCQRSFNPEIIERGKKFYKTDEYQGSKDIVQKVIVLKKMKKKKPVFNGQREVSKRACKCKYKSEEKSLKGNPDTVWVNLDELQSSTAIDTGSRCGSSKTCVSGKLREKPERAVEVYDFPSRHYSKQYKDIPHLVEKINQECEPNANELSKMDEEFRRKEAKKKQETNDIAAERGVIALKKEKINREYYNLVAKLDELNKKEKIIKTQQRNPNILLHMNDERLEEKARAKQKVMNAKFESIYYEAAAHQDVEPHFERRDLYDRSAGGDYVDSSEVIPSKLSFSPDNLKTNTPVSFSSKSPIQTSPDVVNRHRKTAVKTRKKKLLSDIDRTLNEGRRLRKKISQNWRESESNSWEEGSDVESVESDRESLKMAEAIAVPSSDKNFEMEKIVKSQDRESQTENLRKNEKVIDAQIQTLDHDGVDESLPLSTSTSYKSPPSVKRSGTLRQFLDYLEGLSEAEETAAARDNPKFKKKIKKLLSDLIGEGNSSVVEEEKEEFFYNPTLEYYILKLLNMSRECVANLSVSSENISTPNITDLEAVNDKEIELQLDPETEHSCDILPQGEEFVQECRLNRASELEESIKNWKSILGQNLNQKVLEDEPDCPCPASSQEQAFISEPKEKEERKPDIVVLYNSPKTKYDIITRKCSERITELSNMLNEIRKDKEKLLSSTSCTSSLSLNEKSFFKQKEHRDVVLENKHPRGNSMRPLYIDGLIDRYNLSRERDEYASIGAVADSQSFQEESVASSESLPDVMDELLKREILTSPFRWSEDLCTHVPDVEDVEITKPPTIETVIGNFRKEMSKIKPYSVIKSTSSTPVTKIRCTPIEDVHNSPKKSSARKRLFADCSHDNVENEEFLNSNCYVEESSVESINHALTNLGLNWAKSFLKKNEESRAISSSSGSDQRHSSGNEVDNYYDYRSGNN